MKKTRGRNIALSIPKALSVNTCMDIEGYLLAGYSLVKLGVPVGEVDRAIRSVCWNIFGISFKDIFNADVSPYMFEDFMELYLKVLSNLRTERIDIHPESRLIGMICKYNETATDKTPEGVTSFIKLNKNL